LRQKRPARMRQAARNGRPWREWTLAAIGPQRGVYTILDRRGQSEGWGLAETRVQVPGEHLAVVLLLIMVVPIRHGTTRAPT
jgi:hypothetical protein